MLCCCGTRGSLCQASLWTAYYQGTQCSHLRRTRAEPVCRINWIRWYGTFPSCLLRRKLHNPFSYVAGDAACYAWRRFDKTALGHAERGIPGAARKSRREISFACDAIIYEQYVILYYIVEPTYRGPNSNVHASLEI